MSVLGGWAALVPPSGISSAGAMRRLPGIRALLQDDGLWLSGPSLDEATEQALLALPGARRFRVDNDGRCTPEGSRVPITRLPGLVGWRPIQELLEVALPAALLPARLTPGVVIRLERGGDPAPANVLLTEFARWRSFAVSAGEVRLRGLMFAADHRDRVVVWGESCPPISGSRFVERGGIAIPVGHVTEPALPAAVLAEALGLEAGALALLGPAGGWDRIPAAGFVGATRSAVRRTWEHLRAR